MLLGPALDGALIARLELDTPAQEEDAPDVVALDVLALRRERVRVGVPPAGVGVVGHDPPPAHRPNVPVEHHLVVTAVAARVFRRWMLRRE